MTVRDQMPATASLIDEIRATFGEDARVVYARENGLEVGTEIQVERHGYVAVETGRRHIGPEPQRITDSGRTDVESEAQALVRASLEGRAAEAVTSLHSRYSEDVAEQIKRRGRELWRKR